jgi:tRNA(Ile)-lysidine synthase
MLQMYQPRLVEHLGRLASVLRGDNEFLEASAQAWIEKEAQGNPDAELSVSLTDFLRCPEPIRRRVTRRLLIQVRETHRRVGHSHIESVEILARGDRPQAVLAMPDGVRVKRVYDRLVFTRQLQEKVCRFQFSLEGPGEFYVAAAGRWVAMEEIRGDSRIDVSRRHWAGFLDADKVCFPLVLRDPRPGDRFVPLGMTGRRKLKDFFIDLKVPSEDRALTPILVQEGTLVAVCGHRIDERFKVTPQTERILKVTMR